MMVDIGYFTLNMMDVMSCKMVMIECLHLNMMVNNEIHMMVLVYTTEAIMR